MDWSKRLATTQQLETENKIPSITRLVTTIAPKTTLNIKAREIENKILDTTNSMTTPEFYRLAKMSFDARIKKVAKSLANKSQVNNALDITDKNREKMKNFKRLF